MLYIYIYLCVMSSLDGVADTPAGKSRLTYKIILWLSGPSRYSECLL